MLDPNLKTSRNPMLAFFNQVNQIRAESFVMKKLLDQKLTRIGLNTLEAEGAALAGAFEETDFSVTIQTFVHPQQ